MNIQHTVIHIVKNNNMDLLNDKLNEIYIGLIKRRLSSLGLTKKDKISIIDKIIKKQRTNIKV